MKGAYQSDIENIILESKGRRKKRRIVIAVLSLAVAVCTLCALMLPADTAQVTEKVYQVNKYSQAVTTLVHGGTVTSKLGTSMSFKYWDAIIVEKSKDGRLYVSKYEKADGSKLEYKAETADGFVLLLYNKTIDTEVGCIVTVDFDYKSNSGYNAEGLGNVIFSTKNINDSEADNSQKLTEVKGADTRELIEVNLYDYGANINDKYKTDKTWPGFQQDKGTTLPFTSFNISSFNFGNNITADLSAGETSVTVKNGSGINATTDGANSPIGGEIKATLGEDGYPALADGRSLSYLFSTNTYAEKKNSQSINGLFKYNDTTGAYTFNSRENHAQFNPLNDTFTLYDQIITSNFMMYPFGNFLPFNDIVNQCTQVSTIDKSWLQAVATSASSKALKSDDEYATLSARLGQFVGLMDKAYPDGWKSAECINEYFKVSDIPKSFTNDDPLISKLYSIDYDIPTDFYFGMEMKMRLMQPKNGLTGKDGKQPMVFYFTGDDDVWVYIDNVLFLDLSGIHRHVGGEIDFVNGTVNYYRLEKSTGDIGTEPYKTVKFSDLVDSSLLNEKGTFKNYSVHSFNFYYMERGSGSGVCRMNFNFPLIRKNSVAVTKELESDDNGDIGLLGNPDFRFQAMKENGTELFIGKAMPYSVLDAAGNKVGSGVTDDNGIFTVKAGQTALFEDIAENSGRYFIRELLDEAYFEQYGSVTVDGSSATFDRGISVGQDSFAGISSPVKDISDGSTVFHFTNHIDFNELGSLSVKKTATLYSQELLQSEFKFLVTLDSVPLPKGTKYTVSGESREVSEDGIITLRVNEVAKFENILAGTEFSVREAEVDPSDYSVSYTLDGNPLSGDCASGVIKTHSEASVVVHNSETGVTVKLPLTKSITHPDGAEHSYTFLLEQVTDITGSEPAAPPLTREATLSLKTKPASGEFEIVYPKKGLNELPQRLYYRINEKEDLSDTATAYDKSVYVAEVTLAEGEDGITATVTALRRDGIELSVSPPDIAFTNTIVRYELPATGGIGQLPYIAGGLLLALTALLLLYKKYKCRRENE